MLFLSKKSLFVWVFLFPEVALEESCEGLAVSCLVAGHFVDGVVDMRRFASHEGVAIRTQERRNLATIS